MGDISIIARRLHNGLVQYGRGGNGGSFYRVGDLLLGCYTSLEMVEYLFSLGQLEQLGMPGSERGGYAPRQTTQKMRKRHWMGNSEREIFNNVGQVDYGYFYELDECWYYVIPGPFRIKVRMNAVEEHIASKECELEFRKRMNGELITYMFGSYMQSDLHFQKLLRSSETKLEPEHICAELLAHESPAQRLAEQYPFIYNYFEDWVVIDMERELESMGEIHLRPKMEPYEETSIYLLADQ